MFGDPMRDLYPALSNSESALARENLDRYLALAWEICEETHAQPCPSLDGQPVPGQDAEERSISQTN